MLRRIVSFACLLLLTWSLIGSFVAGCGARKEITEQDQAASTNFYRLAVSSYTSGNVIEALGALQEAEKFNPKDPHVKNLFGLIYLGKRMLDQAKKSFEEAIRLDPKFSDAYLHLAIVYMENEQWAKAIDLLTVPANDIMYPRKDLALDNLGWCHHRMGDNVKAIQSLVSATAENPKLCHAWYNLGRIYKSEGRFIEAMRSLEQITRIEECNGFMLAYYELGIVAFRAKSFDRARSALSRCIELGGENPEAAECRNYLNLIP
jgi:tetratricopeptide (TPR) repeat protein